MLLTVYGSMFPGKKCAFELLHYMHQYRHCAVCMLLHDLQTMTVRHEYRKPEWIGLYYTRYRSIKIWPDRPWCRSMGSAWDIPRLHDTHLTDVGDVTGWHHSQKSFITKTAENVTVTGRFSTLAVYMWLGIQWAAAYACMSSMHLSLWMHGCSWRNVSDLKQLFMCISAWRWMHHPPEWN